MQVTITYHDTTALTVEEVVRQAQDNYGKTVDVKCMPDSTMAYDLINFGISRLITHEQIGLMCDKGRDYQSELIQLRAKVLEKLTEIVDQVIIDNEARI
jgi:hypothetical protein